MFGNSLWRRMVEQSRGPRERYSDFEDKEGDVGEVPPSLVPPLDINSDDDELGRLELIRLWRDEGGEG